MEDSTKKILAGVAVVLVLIVGGTVWAVMARDNGPTTEQVKQMGQQLRDSKDLPPEQRREAWQNYWDNYDKLPFAEKKKLAEERRQQRSDRPDPVQDFYATQSQDERNAILDKQIAEEQKQQERWEERRKQREAERAKAAESAGNSGGQQGAAAGGQPGGGPTPQQQQQWDNRRREFLDMRTPEERAQRSDFRLQLRERAQQTGQPLPSGGGFGGGFGGGGPRGGGPPR